MRIEGRRDRWRTSWCALCIGRLTCSTALLSRSKSERDAADQTAAWRGGWHPVGRVCVALLFTCSTALLSRLNGAGHVRTTIAPNFRRAEFIV
jgi:hypothetical protein